MYQPFLYFLIVWNGQRDLVFSLKNLWSPVDLPLGFWFLTLNYHCIFLTFVSFLGIQVPLHTFHSIDDWWFSMLYGGTNWVKPVSWYINAIETVATTSFKTLLFMSTNVGDWWINNCACVCVFIQTYRCMSISIRILLVIRSENVPVDGAVGMLIMIYYSFTWICFDVTLCKMRESVSNLQGLPVSWTVISSCHFHVI